MRNPCDGPASNPRRRARRVQAAFRANGVSVPRISPERELILGDGLTCKELTDFLDDYLAHELDSEVRSEFDRHLSLCPTCVDYLHSYQAAIRLAGSTRSAPESDVTAVPEELIAAILACQRH